MAVPPDHRAHAILGGVASLAVGIFPLTLVDIAVRANEPPEADSLAVDPSSFVDAAIVVDLGAFALSLLLPPLTLVHPVLELVGTALDEEVHLLILLLREVALLKLEDAELLPGLLSE